MPEPNLEPDPPPPVGPNAIAIFGAGGDLTRRKLVPSIYNLARSGLLSDRFAVVGLARGEMDDASFRATMLEGVREFVGDAFDAGTWEWLERRLHYIQGEFDDPASYARLAERLQSVSSEHQTGGNVLFYLATPPSAFAGIVRRLDETGLTSESGHGWRRVIVEKPFGNDLESARSLNREILAVLDEHQVYRIDHYLGKETVQNLLVFRFANSIFEPIWNRRYVDHIQITMAETLGVEQRGNYYDDSGALRDMVPNHLFQLLALIAMEPPTSFQANAIRNERAKVLESVQPFSAEEVLRRSVRGQYGKGAIDGRAVPGYREEPRVGADSRTETYVALKLMVDNWRWADVPFYLRTGKRLPQRTTEIVIQFKRAPFVLFRQTGIEGLTPNQLVIRIQPNEGIWLRFGAKIPGQAVRVGNVEMDFYYADYFGATPSTGYETLLYDCMHGDATLFQRADHLEASWKLVAPILDVWTAIPPREFPNYGAGSWGPEEADALLGRSGRQWRNEP